MALDSAFPSANEALAAFEATRLRIARMRVQGGVSLREFVCRASADIAEALAIERVSVWFFVDARRALSIYHVHTRGRPNGAFEGTLLHVRDFPSYFAALETHRVIAADDVVSDPRTAEYRDLYLVPLGITSMIDVPILRDGVVVGIICHEHTGPQRQWTAAEVELATAFGDMLGAKFAEAAQHDAEAALHGLQAHLVEMRSMAVSGRVIAAIAHDLNNLLAVVLGNAELIVAEPSASAEVVALGQQIQATTQRGRELAHDLLQFGRPRVGQPTVFVVVEHLAEFAASIAPGLGAAHPITVTTPADATAVGRVLMDARDLERIVLNLCVNARDAMPAGGPIAIDVSDAVVRGDEGHVPGNYVLVKVIDRGHGMDAATRARVFEPFFTTKPSSSGSGLGLAIVYDLATRAGGFVHLESEVGAGTTVRLYLPRIA